jgi:serine/threonine protein kinase
MGADLSRLENERFRVIRPLGAGGMSSVYLVFDALRGTELALKVMNEITIDTFRRSRQRTVTAIFVF